MAQTAFFSIIFIGPFFPFLAHCVYWLLRTSEPKLQIDLLAFMEL